MQTRVIDPDGTDGGRTLDPQEWDLQDNALRVLLGTLSFQARYPGAVLVNVESHRHPEHPLKTRLCLVFDLPGQPPVTFWAQWGRQERVIYTRSRVIVAGP